MPQHLNNQGVQWYAEGCSKMLFMQMKHLPAKHFYVPEAGFHRIHQRIIADQVNGIWLQIHLYTIAINIKPGIQ